MKEGEKHEDLDEARFFEADERADKKAAEEMWKDEEAMNRMIKASSGVSGKKEFEEMEKGGEWYPFGMSPGETLQEHYVKDIDTIRILRLLMKRRKETGQPCCVLVADNNAVSNAKKALVAKGYPDNEDTWYRGNSQVLSRRVFDMFTYEAMQEELLEGDEKDEYAQIPVLFMSTILSRNGKFSYIKEDIQALLRKNDVFAKAVYKCVPKRARPSGYENATWEETESMGEKRYEILAYVEDQIAEVLSTRGSKKLGHKKEKPYNRVTVMAANLLGIPSEQIPSFETIEAEDASGDVPYRTSHRTTIGTGNRGALTEGQDLRSGFDRSVEAKDALKREPGLSQAEFRKRLRAIEENRDAEYRDRLSAEKLARNIRRKVLYKIREAFLLTPSQKRNMIDFEIAKKTVEITMSMSCNTRLRCLLEMTGVLDVIKGDKQIADLEGNQSFFRCERGYEERENAFLTRFVLELMQGDNWNSPLIYWPDYMGNTYYRQGMDLHEMAMAHEIAKDKFEIPKWDFRELRRSIFDGEVMWAPGANGKSIEEVKWEELERFYGIIKGTKWETILRGHLSWEVYRETAISLRDSDSSTELSKQAAEIKEFLESSATFSKYFKDHFLSYLS